MYYKIMLAMVSLYMHPTIHYILTIWSCIENSTIMLYINFGTFKGNFDIIQPFAS